MAYSKKAKPGQTTYNMAVADFFKSPEILAVDISALTAAVGSKISAMVIDNFRVEAVNVKIERGDGSLLEEGNASPENDGLNWVYITTSEGAYTSGNRIIITAIDLPGNKTVEEKII
jgi:hypothetical protein